jgi:hypothetical protein
MHDFVHVIRDIAKPILFADDTSIVISAADIQEFQNKLVSVMDMATGWFQNNLLSMNSENPPVFTVFDKTT